MLGLIIGNVCSLLAMVTDSISSSRRTAKGVLMVQNISQLIYCIGAIVLRGYSAAVQNAISILRNFAAMREKQNKWIEYGLIVLGVVLGVCFNNRGIAGLLPVAANLQYSIAVFRFRDNERALKISFMIAVFSFAVFNAVLMNIVGVISNLVVFFAAIANLWKKK